MIVPCILGMSGDVSNKNIIITYPQKSKPYPQKVKPCIVMVHLMHAEAYKINFGLM